MVIRGKLKKQLQRIARGLVVCLALTAALSAAGAGLILAGAIPKNALGTMAAIISTLSVFLGCLLAAKGTDRGKLLLSLEVFAACMLLFILAHMLFSPGRMEHAAGTVISGLCAAVLAGVLGSRPAGRGGRRRGMQGTLHGPKRK